MTFITLEDGVPVIPPNLCTQYEVPYLKLKAGMRDEERLKYMDSASITNTLIKKYGLPASGVKCWENNSTSGNPIIGSCIHPACPDKTEVEIGGFLLGSYGGFGVDISVFVPKIGTPPIVWDDFIRDEFK